MAGAGKKTFVAGEVLTAAQVNDYLMDQAVMRFSGSAARAASITAPTEGMVTYLDDVNSVEFYDGSDWVRLEVNSDDLRNLITASAELLVGLSAGSIVALPAGSEGQVLTINPSSSTGLSWITPSGAGAQAVATVASASTNTALSSSLSAGFYKISTNVSTTWNSSQFRFVDAGGNFYGADLTAGNGTFTIPVNVASVNITTGSFPIRVIIEELSTITTNLIPSPVVNSFDWTVVNGGSASVTPQPAAASFGAFQLTTGSFSAIGPASASTVNASITGNIGVIGQEYPIAIVAQDAATGLWSTAPTASTAKYPFQVFTSNGTMPAVPWATTFEAMVVSGGGGGGGQGFGGPGFAPKIAVGGGGGAGGASLFALPASVSYSVTIGAGGAGGGLGANGTAGVATSMGPATTTGGGYGGGATATPGGLGAVNAGGPGGSGGGGGAGTPPTTSAAGGAGIAGQGFPGAPGSYPSGGAGGGMSASGGAPVSGSVVWGYLVANGGGGGLYGYGGGGTNPNGGGGGGGGLNPPASTFFPAGPGGSGIVLVKAV